MIIGLGVIAGVLMAVREAKVTGQDPEIYWDFSLYAIFFCIVGSRIYYVIFSWDTYKDNLLEIFNLRHGGLAIYGTVIAAFITAFVYCRRKKIPFFQLCDTGIVGLILGQIIGRWGNFMNREAFGEYTDSLLAMRLPVDAVVVGVWCAYGIACKWKDRKYFAISVICCIVIGEEYIIRRIVESFVKEASYRPFTLFHDILLLLLLIPCFGIGVYFRHKKNR